MWKEDKVLGIWESLKGLLVCRAAGDSMPRRVVCEA